MVDSVLAAWSIPTLVVGVALEDHVTVGALPRIVICEVEWHRSYAHTAVPRRVAERSVVNCTTTVFLAL